MATKKKTPTSYTKVLREIIFESDGAFLLKLVFTIILSTFWVKFGTPMASGGVTMNALPLGMMAALLIVRIGEKHQLDRKIFYAVIMVVGILTYFVEAGIVL